MFGCPFTGLWLTCWPEQTKQTSHQCSGSGSFKVVAPYQRRSGAATPGWWPWTGTQTPSSGTPTSDPSGQTWRRCPIMFGSNKLSSSITNMRFFVSGANMFMFNCLVSNDHGKFNFMKKKLFLGTVLLKRLYSPPVTHRS